MTNISAEASRRTKERLGYSIPNTPAVVGLSAFGAYGVSTVFAIVAGLDPNLFSWPIIITCLIAAGIAYAYCWNQDRQYSKIYSEEYDVLYQAMKERETKGAQPLTR